MSTLRTNDNQKELLTAKGFFYILRSTEPDYEEREVTVRTIGPCRLEFIDHIMDSRDLRRVARGSGYDTWDNWKTRLPARTLKAKRLLLYKVVKT